ncbi:hypothetical protein MJM04_35725, partial [Salmonella enterica subsp. enterica serovar Cerro]|nr:hypothetical protein [Salmonella enterica subsp. enterica serovar Cerro]
LKASISGIMTGILLAIARIAGETAPLLFTALSNQFWSTDMMQHNLVSGFTPTPVTCLSENYSSSSSMLMPSERISFNRTLKDSG